MLQNNRVFRFIVIASTTILFMAVFIFLAGTVNAEAANTSVNASSLERYYANQYGNYAAPNTGVVPEYTNSLALLYASQYGNQETAVATPIEYANFLELFYAEQYGNQSAPLIVQAN